MLAAAVALGTGALHGLLLPRLTPPYWPFAAALGYKVIYSALLGAALTLVAVRIALRE